MPLENRKAKAERKKAALEKAEAILDVVKLEKEIINEIDEKVRGVNLNLENAKRWETIYQIQELKYKAEYKNFTLGRSSSKNVVDYENDYLLAKINEHVAFLDYYKSLIDIENAKDTLLEKVGAVKQ